MYFRMKLLESRNLERISLSKGFLSIITLMDVIEVNIELRGDSKINVEINIALRGECLIFALNIILFVHESRK